MNLMTLKLLSLNPRHLQRAYLKFYFVGTRPLRNMKYEVWNFDSGNYLFTTDTK